METRRRRGMGIGLKLGLAIGGVASLTIASGGLDLMAFRQIGGAMEVISAREVPMMATSARLSQAGTDLAVIAPALAASTTPEERAALAKRAGQQAERITTALAQLEARQMDPAALGQLREKSGALVANLKKEDELVARLRGIETQRTNASERVVAQHAALQEKLKPGIDQSVARLQLAADTTLAAGLLAQGAQAAGVEDLKALRARWDANLVEIKKHVEAAEAVADLKEVAGLAKTLVNQSRVLDLRQRELDIGVELTKLIAENTALAGRLTELLEGLSGAAEQATADAAGAAAKLIARSQIISLSVIAASILIAGLVLWLYVVRGIVGRLKRLAGAMGVIADGDLDASVPPSGRDEIGAMANALTRFRDAAVAARDLAQRTDDERKAAAAERRVARLADANRFESTVLSVVEKVSTAATGIHSTADDMASMAQRTSTAALAAASAADQADGSVGIVAAAAEELATSISEIGRQVERSTTITRQAVADAQRTNVTIEELSDAASRIGEVVRLIGEIASQTNLLALNATIEAARAGDAGKGFAVVAAEVKSLAQQTANATSQIAQQIGDMQNATTGAVSAIREIGQTIGQVNEIAASIAAAVEEQGAATLEIARNVSEASQSAQEAKERIGVVSQTADEAGQAAGRLLGAAGGMTSDATTLRAAVDDFVGQMRAGPPAGASTPAWSVGKDKSEAPAQPLKGPPQGIERRRFPRWLG